MPRENLSYERYKFFSYRQQHGQTLKQFITELKQRAIKCKLVELQDSLITTMIICGVSNSIIREQLLQKDELTLDKAIEQCLIIEMSKTRSEAIEGAETSGNSLDAINSRRRSWHSNQHGGKTSSGNQNQQSGTKCNTCQIKNHFASQCFKNKNKPGAIELLCEGQDEILDNVPLTLTTRDTNDNCVDS